MQKSRKPTKKWIVTQVTAVAAWLVALVEAGYEVNDTLVITAIGIASQAAIGYIVANDDTPGGVPVKE